MCRVPYLNFVACYPRKVPSGGYADQIHVISVSIVAYHVCAELLPHATVKFHRGLKFGSEFDAH
jgi:hypothetical protein